MNNAVIFGGTGFIGSFFAVHLIENKKFDKVFLFDKQSSNNSGFNHREEMIQRHKNIIYVEGDVQQTIIFNPDMHISLIANFAAVHREPGHLDHEYFDCNIAGAENVCKWAEKNNCNKIIFSSSIAPYGPSEVPKDEKSMPCPKTAYGSSKLAAEKIHQIWQEKNIDNHLVIVRPGVVFGPTEGGNVSRLIKAVQNNYFFYMGNKKTRKAGVYVKELCRAMYWVLESDKSKLEKITLFNMTMNPGPSIEEYVLSILKILDRKRIILNVPNFFILTAAYLIDFIAKPFSINHPFSPVRIKKLTSSNNILPTYLNNSGYKYKYNLDEAFLDWKKDCPEEWN